jgi:hypothetical protein
MNTGTVIIVCLLAGFILGYVVKDLLTVEKKTTVNVRKQKVKGEGNVFDAVIDVNVDEKKEPSKLRKWLERRKLRKNN